jgi:hypothetical protein
MENNFRFSYSKKQMTFPIKMIPAKRYRLVRRVYSG